MFWLDLPEHIMANLIYVLHYSLRGRGKVLLKAKRDAIPGLSHVPDEKQEYPKQL